MEAAKYRIMGSDYVGVFATATDDFVFAGANLTSNSKHLIAQTLDAKCIDMTISGSDLIGLFARANSNGIVLSNLTLDSELESLRKMDLGINMEIIDSDLNALGNNILANDKVAIINSDYSESDSAKLCDVLGVEVLKAQMGNFKTVGANSILTNTGLVINNRGTAQEQKEWDDFTGFNSVRGTANTGALAIGLSVIANSKAVVAGDSTTGYELARIVEALE